MTAGIASHTMIDTAWITRALTGAEFTDFTVKEPWITVNTEAGRIQLAVRPRDGLLRFMSVVGGGKRPLPGGEEEQRATLALLRRQLDVARVTYYTDTPDPVVRLEYDLPIIAGLSRAQFVSLLRTFAADVAVALRLCWDGE